MIPRVGVHATYHRAPTNLAEDDETRLAAEAVSRLRSAGYHIDCDEDFDTAHRPVRDLPLGTSVAQLADRIRQATTTEEAADILTELTAVLEEVLIATAEFHDGLADAADPHIARRLRHLADERLRAMDRPLLHPQRPRRPARPASAPHLLWQ